ncbi:YciI family protein [Gimesia aquarii]|uniref:Uncharacterized protein n=1 Tax=Gimesia aquarii TaxID=2527964 RepID=A0A517WWV3_9PLAN|nr:YciI family protein [Gimesia aquarii]QDU09682.1 hypothetical protein V202x_30580 [Gimesia aquarii]
MPKYMFIYRGGQEKLKFASPEQIQQVLQMWMDWIDQGIEAGWVLDAGDGLKPGGAIVNMDLTVTKDELSTESGSLISGYSMIEVPDLSMAIELAKDSPMPNSGGTVEIRELTHNGKQYK